MAHGNGVYPTRNFKQGEVLCVAESPTAAWADCGENKPSKYDLTITVPAHKKCVVQGKMMTIRCEGDAARYVWPNVNSPGPKVAEHGLPANLRMEVVGSTMGDTFLQFLGEGGGQSAEGCTASSSSYYSPALTPIRESL